MKDIERAKETLQAEASKAFDIWQAEIAEEYGLFRQAIAQLATFDCLQSLAAVATSVNYVEPEIYDDSRLVITDGRHPMVCLPMRAFTCPRSQWYRPNSCGTSRTSQTRPTSTLPPRKSWSLQVRTWL